MKDTACLLCIHADADLNELDRNAREMATPDIRCLYVRISRRMSVIRRLKVMRRLRKIFKGIRFDVRSATGYQINLVHMFHRWVTVNYFGEKQYG